MFSKNPKKIMPNIKFTEFFDTYQHFTYVMFIKQILVLLLLVPNKITNNL